MWNHRVPTFQITENIILFGKSTNYDPMHNKKTSINLPLFSQICVCKRLGI